MCVHAKYRGVICNSHREELNEVHGHLHTCTGNRKYYQEIIQRDKYPCSTQIYTHDQIFPWVTGADASEMVTDAPCLAAFKRHLDNALINILTFD